MGELGVAVGGIGVSVGGMVTVGRIKAGVGEGVVVNVGGGVGVFVGGGCVGTAV